MKVRSCLGREGTILSKVISGEKLGDVKNWQIPHVDTPGEQKTTGYSEGLATVCEQLPTLEDIESLRKKVYDESYNAGFSKGLEDAESELSSSIGLVKNILDQLSVPVAQIDQEMKELLVRLAIVVAKQILNIEISRDPGHLMKFIEQGVSILPESPMTIYIHLNPRDASRINDMLKSEHKKSWAIVEDESVEAGGCKLFSENSSVDLTLESQLARIATKFFDLDSDDEGPDIEQLSI